MANFKGVGFPLLGRSVFTVKQSIIFPVASALLAVTFSALPFSHRAATAQANANERTIMMCETSSVAVRVYEKEGELLMRAYSRTQNSLWMNNTPIEMQSLAEGVEYRNPLGEMIITVNADAATDDCTIQVADQSAETGRILEREAPLTEPEPTAPEPSTPEAALPDEVEMAVKAALAEEIGDTVTTVESYSRQTWSDGCLGLGGPAEACLAALTEGWQVELVDSATGDRYTYRTNEEGSAVRLDENAGLPTSN